MRLIPFIALLALLVTFAMPAPALAAMPIGSLDLVDATTIAGWASDPDYSGAIWVHIYVDDQFYDLVLANLPRSDVGNHAFHYVHPPFGAGSHQVKVFAIGVSATGQSNGENPLFGGPKWVNSGCTGLQGNALGWCNAVPNYWVRRQADTKRLVNANYAVGINNSYGGTIMELEGRNRAKNLADENGGAAIQLSIWGYGTNNEHQTAAGSECTGWTNTAPFNPIQAQQTNCSWADSEATSNNVDYQAATANGGWQIRLDDPINFTKRSAYAGMHFGQTVQPYDAYLKVSYTIDYNGAMTTYPHPQEIPAVHLALGPNSKAFYYGGGTPWSSGGLSTLALSQAGARLGMQGRSIPGRAQVGNITEGWYSVCSSDSAHCVTIATLASDTMVKDVDLSVGTATYATPIGYFGWNPGAHYDITVYIFPYNYDAVVSGKTVRQHIYALNGH